VGNQAEVFAVKLIRILASRCHDTSVTRWNRVQLVPEALFLKKIHTNNPLKNQNLRFTACRRMSLGGREINVPLTILFSNVIVICLLRDAAMKTEQGF
jgi:hypothetical protein